ncbi:MAG: hypothetical protein ABI771_12685 [Betaproteobacteria bacterium]
MQKAFFFLACCLTFASNIDIAGAQQLPKTGIINFHTGWGKPTGSDIEVAKKRVQGAGVLTGVTFNDKGSGPLHQGAATCSYIYFAIESQGRSKVFCAFGDADGDKIFTESNDATGTPDGWAGGLNEIIGGTGKYKGITGKGPWKTRYTSRNGESWSMQQLEYRLP